VLFSAADLSILSEVSMAEKLESSEIVTLEELAISNSSEIAAIISDLEKKGLLSRHEGIEEIQRLRKP
jgi:predicted transcriptional regulator of viral defense system